MKKAFSVGGLVIFAAIIFIAVKVVLPKIQNGGALALQAAMELENAFNQIRDDYILHGKFRELRSMTAVRQFDNSSLDTVVEVDKPMLYGVGVKSKGNFQVCASITLKEDKQGFYLEINPENRKIEACKNFQSMDLYKKMQNFRVSK